VIWIRQIGRNREANLTDLAERLFDRLKTGTTDILVLLGVPRGIEWVEVKVDGMIGRGKSQYPNVAFTLKTFTNLNDRDGVQDAILSFEPLDLGEISLGQVRAKVTKGRVLCFSIDGKTRILDALSRANFTHEVIAECFVEERIGGARNSNLMEVVAGKAKNHSHLLYAWDGLRTLKPHVKAKYESCFEAPTAAMVVDMFRRWILEGD
jgi:hypothetical protein